MHVLTVRLRSAMWTVPSEAHEWLREQAESLSSWSLFPAKSEEARRRYPQLDTELTQKDRYPR